MMRRLPGLCAIALLLSGCAMPSWVPWVGKQTPAPSEHATVAGTPVGPPVETAQPGSVRMRPFEEGDDAVTDRVIAVVNNDAITLAELQESVASRKSEARQQQRDFADDAVLQESLKVQKLVRRKVALRVSVTDGEITQYLEENRTKLETGLSYHARHILVIPDADTDAGWEGARIKADMLRSQILQGADFAELAKQHSRDATAKDGGDLGTLKRGELSQDVEGAILVLKVEEVSQPFKSALGYHVFRLESKESLDGDGMVRIRQQIKDILFRQKYDTRLEVWIKEIRQRAIIEVRL